MTLSVIASLAAAALRHAADQGGFGWDDAALYGGLGILVVLGVALGYTLLRRKS